MRQPCIFSRCQYCCICTVSVTSSLKETHCTHSLADYGCVCEFKFRMYNLHTISLQKITLAATLSITLFFVLNFFHSYGPCPRQPLFLSRLELNRTSTVCLWYMMLIQYISTHFTIPYTEVGMWRQSIRETVLDRSESVVGLRWIRSHRDRASERNKSQKAKKRRKKSAEIEVAIISKNVRIFSNS